MTLFRTVLTGVLAAFAVASQAQPGELIPTFNPNDEGFGKGDRIGASVLQDGLFGRTLVGGDFANYNGIPRGMLLRLEADGSLDMSFGIGAGANNAIGAIAMQADGKIIIGGDFTSYDGVSRIRVARVDINGALDPSFNPGSGAQDYVHSIAVQPDGKILVAGQFLNFGGPGHRGIVRLNSDGSVDATFNTVLLGQVQKVLLQADGKILLCGSWSSINGVPRNRIARLHADGSLDTSFDPGVGPNNEVYTAIQRSNGRLVIGGKFLSYGGSSRRRIAELNTDGSLYTAFDPGTGADSTVWEIVEEPDGRLLIGGEFTTFNGIARERIARIDFDGSVEPMFNTSFGADERVSAILVRPNATLMIGGGFWNVQNVASPGLARLSSTGACDPAFNPGHGFNSLLLRLAATPSGGILAVGAFQGYNGARRHELALLYPDGSLDMSFDPGVGTGIYHATCLAVQADGRILIGGGFLTYHGVPRAGIARLLPDGSLDGSFDPGSGVNGSVTNIRVQPDGRILIAGTFTTFNGVARARLARLNSDGSLDTGFDPGTSTTGGAININDLVLQADGRILICGYFTSYNGTPRNRLARLNSDGSLDASFTIGTGANGAVTAIALAADGDIYLGGQFTLFNGTPRTRLARLNADGSLDTDFDPGNGPAAAPSQLITQADGRLLVAGGFTNYGGQMCNGLLRVMADGSMDGSFALSNVGDATVLTMALIGGDALVIGGDFVSYDGVGRNRIALLRGCVIGAACDDGDPCTAATYDYTCNCAGPTVDTDSDGILDCNDSCPAVPGTIGSACDDGDPGTPFSQLTAACECEAVALDPGTVIVEVEDEFTYFEDGHPLVPGAHVVIRDINNVVVYADGYSDATGVFTATNIPAGNHNITVSEPMHATHQGTFTLNPGATLTLAIFIPRVGPQDQDNDGYFTPADCDDANPAINQGAAEVCSDGIDNDCDGAIDETATYYADVDGDGFGDPAVDSLACAVPVGYVANNTDQCPTDAAKTSPGICGCGVPDTDTDTDGTPDCNDGCPSDPLKTSLGICGCGIADSDSDGDLTADCNDGCPGDPLKIAPGTCGCGIPDTDTDGDLIVDCLDDCPGAVGEIGSPCSDGDPCTVNDALNASCACMGNLIDTDGDGTPDCTDACPTDPSAACGNGGCCPLGTAIAVTNPGNVSPPLDCCYPSLAAAFSDLNAATGMSGPVTLTCTVGMSETAPPTGIVLGSSTLNPLLNATNTITIISSGAGTYTVNAGIGTATPASAVPDGMLVLDGADHVTIDGLTFVDGNASNPASMEFGVALFKRNAGDGARDNTIRNCTFHMQRGNNAAGTLPMMDGAVGILVINATRTAATTNLTPTGTVGGNSNNSFHANTINGGNTGIGLSGFASTNANLFDSGNDIGGQGTATGNTIRNFGGGGTTSAAVAIRTREQRLLNIRFCTIRNNDGGGVNHSATLRGILAEAATNASATITDNSITLSFSGISGAICSGIENAMGGTAVGSTIDLSNNTVTAAFTALGLFRGIVNTATVANLLINNCSISNCTFASASGTFNMILAGPPVSLTTNSNAITNNGRGAVTNSQWSMIEASPSSQWTATDNTISGLSMGHTSASANLISGLRLVGASPCSITFTGNTVSNISVNTTNINAIHVVNTAGGTRVISNNTVSDFSQLGADFSGIGWYGIRIAGGPANYTVSGNNIHSISRLSGSGAVRGIQGGDVSTPISGTSLFSNNSVRNMSVAAASCVGVGLQVSGACTVRNNLVGALNAPANASNGGVTGMELDGVGSITVDHNTVWLAASSGISTFISTAIDADVITAVTLRNNILVNLSSANQVGAASCYRRNGTALTNYQAASDRNIFHAGTPGPNRIIFTDGTNSDQTLEAYRQRMVTRDQCSMTENVDFISLDPTQPAFLHLAGAAQAEGAGVAIAGVTTDLDGEVRDPVAPDVGADEFIGAAVDGAAPSISYTLLSSDCTAGERQLTATITDCRAGVPTSGPGVPHLYWCINGGAWNASPGTHAGGALYTFSLGTGASYGDAVSYYVVAQDLAAAPNASAFPLGASGFGTTPPSASVPPPIPSSYTVGQALGGTYTVGAGGAFATLTAAVAAYNTTPCMSGPVVFELTDATYPTETFPITVLRNASASTINTLTIRPAVGATPLITGSATTLIEFTGARYVTLDGSHAPAENTCCPLVQSARHMTIRNTAGTSVVRVTNTTVNNGEYVTVRNCVINGNGATTNGVLLQGTNAIGTGSTGLLHTLVENNTLSAVQHGIFADGPTNGNIGTRLVLNEALNGITRTGISATDENGIVISCNTIGTITRGSGGDVAGISVGFGTAVLGGATLGSGPVRNATITNNRINGVKHTAFNTAAGIAVGNTTTGINLVANNTIQGVACNGTSTEVAAGILLGGGAGSSTQVLHNTVSMDGAVTGANAAASTSSCLAITNVATGDLDVRNNIFNNTQVGNAGATMRFVAFASAGSTFVSGISDHNDLYAAGAGPGTYFAGITGGVHNGAAQATLVDLRNVTGQDLNSVDALATFLGASDLHLDPSDPINALYLAAGGVSSSITSDPDCLPRNISTPTIGAFELMPTICTAMPEAGLSQGGPDSLCVGDIAQFTNNAVNTLSGVLYQWLVSIDGPSGPWSTAAGTGSNSQYFTTDSLDAGTYHFTLGAICTTTGDTAFSNAIPVFADADTDGDATCDLQDGCPTDALKIAPGTCGCGVGDVDTDGDGVSDCIDTCPLTAGQIGDPCDDNDPNTNNDVLNATCICSGASAQLVRVAARVHLEGPYNAVTGLMGDGMRALGLVPTTEPYTGMGYVHVGGGAEVTTPAVLANAGNDAIVDWVVLELRGTTSGTVVMASRSALLQRDGDVVDLDGVSPVSFTQPAGSYHLAVRHRNHLGAMTLAPVPLTAAATTMDLTDGSIATYGAGAQKVLVGTYLLWAGDVTFDGVLKYTGLNNDRDPILIDIGGTVPTNTSSGYHDTDVNMDGTVKYTGLNNDRDPILINVGGTVPTAVRVQQLP